MAFAPETKNLPVIELPAPVPEPSIGEVIVAYKFPILLRAMKQHRVELRVHRQTDLLGIYKAADRAGFKLWTTKEHDPENADKVVTRVRLRTENETVSPFYRGDQVRLSGRVLTRGRWLALALAAIADGVVVIEGDREAAIRVVKAIAVLARRSLPPGSRPRPSSSYSYTQAEESDKQWKVTVSADARAALAQAIAKRKPRERKSD